MRLFQLLLVFVPGTAAFPFRQQVSPNGQDPSFYEVQQAMQQMPFFKNVNFPAQMEFLTIAMNMDTPRGEILSQLDAWAAKNNVQDQWANFKTGVNIKKTELISSLRTMFSKLPSAFEEIVQNDNNMALSQNQALQRMSGVFAALTQGVGTALNNFVDYLFGNNGQTTGNNGNWIPGQNGNGGGFPGNNGVFPGNNNGNNNGGFSGNGFPTGNNNGNGNSGFPGGVNNNGNGNGTPGSNNGGFPNNNGNNNGFLGNNYGGFQGNGNNGNNMGNSGSGQNGNNGVFSGNNNNGFSGNNGNNNGGFPRNGPNGNGNGGFPGSGNNNGVFPGSGVFPSGSGGQGIVGSGQGNSRPGILNSGPFFQNGFARF